MKKLNLNAEIILNKKFDTELSGYNASEVDKYLDQIIEDYHIYEEKLEIMAKKLEEKTSLISERESVIENLKASLDDLKEQLRESSRANNYELLKEIRKLQEK